MASRDVASIPRRAKSQAAASIIASRVAVFRAARERGGCRTSGYVIYCSVYESTLPPLACHGRRRFDAEKEDRLLRAGGRALHGGQCHRPHEPRLYARGNADPAEG